MAALLIIILRMLWVITTGDKVEVGTIYGIRKVERRGDIYDRNSVLVATDLKTKSLYLNAVLIKNPLATAKSLAKIFSDVSESEVLAKIKNNKRKNWIPIKRNVTPGQEQKVRDLKIAGPIFEEDLIRVYPQRSIASHLVGYVGIDRDGLAGIEMAHNSKLAKGEDVKLALDIRLQDVLYSELIAGLAKYKAKAASGVILDANNGEVLALVSAPSFDSNDLNSATREQKFNYATQGVYELGSVFKIFTNTIAFEKNLIKMSDVFEVGAPIKYGRFTIDDHKKVKDKMTVEEIFMYSSNIGTVQIAKKIGPSTQREYLEKFGLLKKLDTDFPGLARPIYPKSWSEISSYTISYGHGIAVTPLHIATAAIPIVNGGIAYNPSFIKLDKAPEGKRVISESTSKIMQDMLRKVVTGGTGSNAKIKDYEIAGKTGTGEKLTGGSYDERKNIASFVAVFPAASPRYVIYIVVDQPNFAFNTGGMVAAPIATNIIKGIAPIIELMPASSN